jgi:hypothetical protein
MRSTGSFTNDVRNLCDSFKQMKFCGKGGSWGWGLEIPFFDGRHLQTTPKVDLNKNCATISHIHTRRNNIECETKKEWEI